MIAIGSPDGDSKDRLRGLVLHDPGDRGEVRPGEVSRMNSQDAVSFAHLLDGNCGARRESDELPIGKAPHPSASSP